MLKVIDFMLINSEHVVHMDSTDFPKVSNRLWEPFLYGGKIHAVAYEKAAYRSEEYKVLFLEDVIMDPPRGLVVAHVDGDPLNNRRANLKIHTSRSL